METENTPLRSVDDPELFFNRELSLLEFNRRVLEQAKDPRTPLLERLRFLTICSTNLDEFFEIRAARLRQQVAFDIGNPGPDGLSPQEVLVRISQVAHELVEEQYRVLNEVLLPALAAEGIRVIKRSDWSEAESEWIRAHFHDQVMPVLTPIGLDPTHPFPKVLNKSLNFIVTLQGDDAFGRSSGIAVVQVPRALPRVIPLPRELSGAEHHFVLLSSVVHAHVDVLFPGMEVTGCHQFRTTRNGDLSVDEEEVDNLLLAVQGELANRRYGATVRLEVADNCSQRMCRFLLRQFELDEPDLYQVNGPVNMHRLGAIIDRVDRPELKYEPFVPSQTIHPEEDYFAVLRRGDVLLHHPYQGFAPVLDLLRQAALDPKVLAIKQTLYRTGADSPVVDALIEAARAGKEVTVLVELRARFDEAANIRLAERLQEAGANVVYGIVGYKTHAKLLIVIRREGEVLRCYSHVGTGNYHTRTARLYTDFGLLTADQAIGEDVQRLFLQLTGLGQALPMNRLLQAPFTLHETTLRLIRAEAEAARQGRSAGIRAKMNSLTEPEIIRALYEASQAGVKIDLIVRGICRLRPGVPGVSDTIRVRSVIGRFLEHHRVYSFYAGGEELLYLSSADWMERNCFYRVEAAIPVQDPELKARVMRESFELYLADGEQAWVMQPDGSYERESQKGPAAQKVLLEELVFSLITRA
ncbi:MAG: polyphosphate kinase 1 [Alphaproteobacteria bacterium]|nr:polyphosphate kinase 1 [Alphaproteobacteria bacterium]MCB9795141.1 polyphosphate kinase 1 [Alphaproteobacteria bacterium]